MEQALARIHESTPQQEIQMYNKSLIHGDWILTELLIKRGVLFLVGNNRFMDIGYLPENIQELYYQHYIYLISQENNGIGILGHHVLMVFYKDRQHDLESVYLHNCPKTFNLNPNLLKVFHINMTLKEINGTWVFPNVTDLKCIYEKDTGDIGKRIFPNIITLYVICVDNCDIGYWQILTLRNLTIDYKPRHLWTKLYLYYPGIVNDYPNMESLTMHNICIGNIKNLKCLTLNYCDFADINVDELHVNNYGITCRIKCNKLTVSIKDAIGCLNRIKVSKSLNLLYKYNREVDDIIPYLSRQVICNNVVFTRN